MMDVDIFLYLFLDSFTKHFDTPERLVFQAFSFHGWLDNWHTRETRGPETIAPVDHASMIPS